MNSDSNETAALNPDELSIAEIDAFLGGPPATKAEFMALARIDRQKLAENRHNVLICLNLVAGPDGKIDDADFASQVEELWAIMKPSKVKREPKPVFKRRRRRLFRKST